MASCPAQAVPSSGYRWAEPLGISRHGQVVLAFCPNTNVFYRPRSPSPLCPQGNSSDCQSREVDRVVPTVNDFPLSPSQAVAFDALLQAMKVGRIIHLRGATGLGKTTLLRRLHQKLGGIYLTNRELMELAAGKHPHQLEDVFYSVLMKTLKAHDIVFLDDFDQLQQLFSCNHYYARRDFIDVPMLLLCDYAEAAKKKIVIAAH